MQYITSGNRIAVENFTVGYLYTITFTGGEYIHCACTGIGMDFVMFSRTAPEYTFALTMETAEGVSSIDLYSEGGGTMNYNDLTNKPQINGVELTGNKTSGDIGIQPLITADNKLSYTLISGLGTAATTSSSDYATAAQGSLADSAVQPADMNSALNAKQNLINSDNMLSADLVDDTSTTNKFATDAELQQIETNKNNISWNTNQGVKNLATINSFSFEAGTSAATAFQAIPVQSTKSGSYTISIGQLSSTATGDKAWIRIKATDGTVYDPVEVTKGNNIVYTANFGARVPSELWVYPANSLSDSYSKTVTCSNVMVCLKSLYDADPTYQPYALSNAELTAKEQVNENNISSLQITEIAITVETAIDDLPMGTVTSSPAVSIAGYSANTWLVIHTYDLNTAGTRRMQVIEATDNTRKTRFKGSGGWGNWA